MALLDTLSGHLFTVAPVVRERLRPSPALSGEAFEAQVDDPHVRDVRVTGLLVRKDASAPLLVIVHGLGGSIRSPYMTRLARLSTSMGASTLLLNLRGADRGGDDVYHAGLTADLSAALASPTLREFSRVAVLGCSIGGHMVLRWGLAPSDARVRAIASLCAPLDLHQGSRDIDAAHRVVYREHVLTALKEIYVHAHARGRAPTELARVLSVRTIRAWDELVVVPRFGFRDVSHYYDEAQVAPRLHALALPARLVVAKSDPMVLARPLTKYFERLPAHARVHFVEGGHLGFPRLSGVERELIGWLLERARA